MFKLVTQEEDSFRREGSAYERVILLLISVSVISAGKGTLDYSKNMQVIYLPQNSRFDILLN